VRSEPLRELQEIEAYLKSILEVDDYVIGSISGCIALFPSEPTQIVPETS
jgi:hypothetical protein